jgi:hypothetical protein
MKKIIAIVALFIGLQINAQVTPKWPLGPANNITLGAGATNNVTLINGLNYIGTIPTLTANTTVSVTTGSTVKAGAIFIITVKTTSTETTTFTGAIVAPVVTGVTGKTWSQAFIYNGTNFYPAGAKIQVD